MNHPIRIVLSVMLCFTFHTVKAQAVPGNAPALKVDNIRYFPFTVDESALLVKVNVHDTKVEQYYNPLFKKYHYAANTQTWEDMIEELLTARDLEFSLNNKLDYQSDKNNFILKATSREELDHFLRVVQPTFAVIAKLEAFIKDVDPKQIHDGSHEE